MGGGEIFIVVGIGAVVIGAVWLLARRAAWSDARPALPPLSIYGDFPNVPADARSSRSAELSGVGRSEAKTDRLSTHEGGTRTGHPGAV